MTHLERLAATMSLKRRNVNADTGSCSARFVAGYIHHAAVLYCEKQRQQ